MRVDIGLDWDTATKKTESGQMGDMARKCNQQGMEADQTQTDRWEAAVCGGLKLLCSPAHA